MADDITKEIDELIGSLADGSSKEVPIGDVTPPTITPPPEDVKVEDTTPPPTPILDEKKDETIPEDKEGAPAPKTDDGIPAKEVPVPDSSTPVGSGDETQEELRERIKLLLSHIENITTVSPIPPATVVPKAEDKSKEVVPTPISDKGTITVTDFVGDKSIDDIIDSKEQLNDLLNQVYQKARVDAKEDAAKAILSALPELVSTQVKDVNDTATLVNDFFKVNDDLLYVRKTVSQVAAQVHAEKPELDIQGVFNEAANRTRTLLGIKRAVKNSVKKFDDPAFVDPNSVKKKVVASSGIQKEIDELIS
jgi:hypothetical protein